MDATSRRLEHLSPEGSRRLLEAERRGRLAYTVHALPAVSPVVYTPHTDVISVGLPFLELADELDGQVVCLHVDGALLDPVRGWSVTAVGIIDVDRDLPGSGAGWGRLRNVRLDGWRLHPPVDP